MARHSRKINDCPDVAATLALKCLCGRWKILILRLLLERPHRYAELKQQLSGITDKMLAQQLKEMEEDNILIKDVIVVDPPKTVRYELTEVGYYSRNLLNALTNWGKSLSEDDVL